MNDKRIIKLNGNIEELLKEYTTDNNNLISVVADYSNDNPVITTSSKYVEEFSKPLQTTGN